MTGAVIVATARAGLAKSWRGALNMTHPVTFTGHVLQRAMQRARLDPKEVEDVIVGGTFMEGAAGMNVARQGALRAGCPATTAGVTVNRVLSPRLQTIPLPAPRIIARAGETYSAHRLAARSLLPNPANT